MQDVSLVSQIAKHEYFAHIRRQKRFVEEDVITYEKSPISVEDEVIDQTEAVRIQKILSTLPEPYREVFTLRVLVNLDLQISANCMERVNLGRELLITGQRR